MARGTGDPGALAAALNARRVAIWDIDHAEERLEVATEMTGRRPAPGTPRRRCRAGRGGSWT